MYDAIREAFDLGKRFAAAYDAVDEAGMDRIEKEFPTLQSQTALSANGGEAVPVGYLSHVTLKTLADGKPVKLYPAASDWVCKPVYTHPAPPSVAVPEGWIPFPTEAWLFLTGEGPLAGRHFGDIVCDDKTGRDKPFWWRSHIRHMLTAAPSPDHIADAGKVVPDDAILARAWYHAGEDGDYNIYDALNADCPDCVEVLIVRADAARLRTAGDEGEGV